MDNTNDPNSANTVAPQFPPAPQATTTPPQPTVDPLSAIPNFPQNPSPNLSQSPQTPPSLPTWPPITNPSPTITNPIPGETQATAQPNTVSPSSNAPKPELTMPTPSWPNIQTPASSPPTFTPPTPSIAPTTPTASTSPLDNPWGSPAQTSNITPTSNPGVQPSWSGVSATSAEQISASPQPITPMDSAPTDLSHLISGNSSPENNPTTQAMPETLVVPSQTSNPEVPTVAAENHKGGIPKWVIGLGIGLLIIVAGASAYFILGVGQPTKTPTSIPAVETPKTTTQQVKNSVPTVTAAPVPTPQAQATGSASFGQIQGGAVPTPQAQATSAADLLRRGQQTQ